MPIDNVTYLKYARRDAGSIDHRDIPPRPDTTGPDDRAGPDDLWFGRRSIGAENWIFIALVAVLAVAEIVFYLRYLAP